MTKADKLQVRIGTEVYLYQDKEPFVKSGFGDHGALRLDPDSDRVMCHECGEYFKAINRAHLYEKHQGMTAREYKFKHGLPQYAALTNETIRISLIQRARLIMEKNPGFAGKPLTANHKKKMRSAANKSDYRKTPKSVRTNLAGHCRAQLLDELRQLGKKLKRTPTYEEIKQEIGVWPQTIATKFGGMQTAYLEAGLTPPNSRFKTLYTDAKLLKLLNMFFKRHRRIPSNSDCRRGVLPNLQTFKNRFGSMANAITAAGLPLTPWRYAHIHRASKKEVA